MAKMQLGKKGLTDNVKTAIKNAFKTRTRVKIKVLKSATRDQERVEDIAHNIKNMLGDEYEYNVKGFTIDLKKHE